MTKNRIEEVEIVKHHSSLYLKNRGGRTGSRAQHQTEVERDESGRSQSGWDRPWKASATVSVCQERFVSRLRSQSGSNTVGFLSAQTDIQLCLSAPSVCSWWFCCWTFPHKSWPDVALYKAANLVQMPLFLGKTKANFCLTSRFRFPARQLHLKRFIWSFKSEPNMSCLNAMMDWFWNSFKC